ncbi:hypothetical protein K443DRAFT_671201 [Laccaria amethystina LaAM-08-1]|uniref:Uncharacterized protein n=1 Tax=Laccaria amethystina LaAM-08-1 TaxID=1095629 RepID=A0A0C9Y775_9AGAR|nr:hypothetical protein K443DRAFT_681317 [Laccaria amethystina LaAM-08-1]KIK09889.1 hypothetical protein K443DRAFT_671201 [Laccaria amethystina LaAM-08-1]
MTLKHLLIQLSTKQLSLMCLRRGRRRTRPQCATAHRINERDHQERTLMRRQDALVSRQSERCTAILATE